MKKSYPPEKLKTFQDWCIDTLYMILKTKTQYKGNLLDQGYIYTIKSIVDHFSSMYYCGLGKTPCRNKEKEHINLWWDHLNQRNRKQFFAPLIMSIDALKFLQSNENILDFGGLSGNLKLEHITPTSYVYGKLRKLEHPTRKEIAACFKHCKLILLTKEESKKYLDGMGAVFTVNDIEMLQKEFQISGESLEEARRLVNKSPKSAGFGLLRMVRLHNSGILFCNLQGKPIEPKEFLTYLTKDNYNFSELP